MTTATAAPPSFTFQRGADARRAYMAELAKWESLGPLTAKPKPAPPPNPLIGKSGQDWQAGYDSVSPETQEPENNGAALPPGRTSNGNHTSDSPIGKTEAHQDSGHAARVRSDVLSAVPSHAKRLPIDPDFRIFGIVLIVDFCSLLYRAFFAGEPSNIHAVRSMFETLANTIERVSPEFIVFALDGGHVERSSISPKYKADRPPRPPELQRQMELAEQAIDAIGWPSIRVVGWEADDVCASLVHTMRPLLLPSAQILVATSDKDALQLVSLETSVYHPWDKGTVFNTKAVQAKFGVLPNQIRDYLALAGDGTDGVNGVEGIGPKTAASLLHEFGSLEAVLTRSAEIKGKVGEKLRSPEQQEATRLDYRLVTLCHELPVGSHWSRFPLAQPSAGWKQKLVELKLGMVPARLEPLLKNLNDWREVARQESPRFQMEWSRPASPMKMILARTTAGNCVRYVPAESHINNLVELPVSPESIEPPRSLSQLPSDATLAEKLAAVHAVGLYHFRCGKPIENSYRHNTADREAMAQGLAGTPLEIDLTLYDAGGWLLGTSPVDDEEQQDPPESEPGLFGPVEPAPFDLREPSLAELGVEPLEVPAPLKPLPGADPLPFADLAQGPPSPEPTSPAETETYQMQPPAIRCLSELLLGCHNEDEAERDFWRTITMRLALELAPETWNFPITNASEAFTTLQLLEANTQRPPGASLSCSIDNPAARAEFIATVNSILKRLFQGDDMPAATAAKRPSKSTSPASRPTALSPSEQLEAIRLLCAGNAELDQFWRSQKGNAWSDDQLQDKLSSLWLTGGRLNDPPAIASSLGTPSVWFGRTTTEGEPDLRGSQLYAFIREVFELTRPGKPAKDDTACKISEKIETRPLSWFKKSPYDKRTEPTENELRDLADSLKQHGQWNACLARPTGEHIAGWRRVQAAKLIGWKELQVRIVTCDDLTARLMVTEENAKRKDLTEREQCLAYNELLAEYTARNWSREKLAATLSIALPTLENKLRLKWISPAIWDLYEARRLDIDQLRALATHAPQAGFLPAFMLPLTKAIALGEDRISNDLFSRAVAMGIAEAYRPMKRDEHGDGAQFRPKPVEREQLGIIKIQHPQRGEIEVATNVEVWEKLNSAAAEKQSAKEEKRKAAEPAPSALKPAKAAALEKNNAKRIDAIKYSWQRAYAASIAAKFEPLKKKDHAQLFRIGLMVQQTLRENEQLQLSEVLAEEETFVEKLRKSVVEFFTIDDPIQASWKDIQIEELKKLSDWLGVEPGPHWMCDRELLATCNETELQQLREDMELEAGLEDGNRQDLEARILNEWQPGGSCVEWCPDMFLLKKAK